MTYPNPVRYFRTSGEITRLAVIPCVRFPLSQRNVVDLLHERGIDVSHETIRFWWKRNAYVERYNRTGLDLYIFGRIEEVQQIATE